MPSASKKKKRGPVETIEGKGVKIPIYYSPIRGVESFQLAFYKAGKRERERVGTIGAARVRAKELIEELSTGQAHVGTFSPKQSAAVNEAIEILIPLRVPLTEAVRQFAEAHRQLRGQGSIADAVKCFLDHRRRIQLAPIKIPDLVEKYLEHLREQNKSRRYTLDMQARLHKAAAEFTGMVGDIHATDVNRWLIGMKKISGRTKNNYRNALATLFSFARQQGYLARGIQTEVEFSTRYDGRGGEIGIYTSEKLKTLLFNIDPRFVPFVALGAFGGLRSTEIVRLEWPEIRDSHIEIKKDKAKTASRRLIPIQPSLGKWLAPFHKKSGRVLVGVQDEFALATQFKKAVDAIVGENGQPSVSIVHNGLRHSFITYRMAVIKNAAEVAMEAGNSTRMIFEHYRELATEKEGAAWFAIAPTKARLATLKGWVQGLP